MDRIYIACGLSFGFLVGAFFLGGFHHELRHQLWIRRRRRERGGYVA